MHHLARHKQVWVFLEFPQAILIAEIYLHTLIVSMRVSRWVSQNTAAGSNGLSFEFFPFIHAASIILIMTNWEEKLRIEFERAQTARENGNEGQARVCARRAAGIAIREYYARRGQTIRTPSAYDLLHLVTEETHLPRELKQAAAYLTLRVTEEFKLPVEVDLIDEARKLCDGLLED